MGSRPTFDCHPSDVTLIRSYLQPWVSVGANADPGFVHVADLYGAEPGHLARRFTAAVSQDGERAWYFLSPLRTKSPNGRRKSRTVPGSTGWWHGEAGPKPVHDPHDGGRVQGYRQTFSFMKRDAAGEPVRTGWIMVELRLVDEYYAGVALLGEALVLCKMYPSPRHPEALEEANEADGEPCTSGGKMKKTDDNKGCSNAVTMRGGRHIRWQAGGAPACTPGGKMKNMDDNKGSSNVVMTRGGRHIRWQADDEASARAAKAATMALGQEKVADNENELASRSTIATEAPRQAKAATMVPGLDKVADNENKLASGTTMAMAAPELKEKFSQRRADGEASTGTTKVATMELGQEKVAENEIELASRTTIATEAPRQDKAATTVPGQDKVVDNENELASGTTIATEVPRLKDKAVDDNDLAASPPTGKRARTVDDEGGDVSVESVRKKISLGFPSTKMNCPQCGCMLHVVSAKPSSEIEVGTRIAHHQVDAQMNDCITYAIRRHQ